MFGKRLFPLWCVGRTVFLGLHTHYGCVMGDCNLKKIPESLLGRVCYAVFLGDIDSVSPGFLLGQPSLHGLGKGLHLGHLSLSDLHHHGHLTGAGQVWSLTQCHSVTYFLQSGVIIISRFVYKHTIKGLCLLF